VKDAPTCSNPTSEKLAGKARTSKGGNENSHLGQLISSNSTVPGDRSGA
jgi:hypothetical protein